jgi:hypothetical protein
VTETEWEGIITLDVPFWATEIEGPPKHEDPEQIGRWLAFRVQGLLRSDYENSVGAAVGEVVRVSSREEKWRDWHPEEAAIPVPEPDERHGAGFDRTLEVFNEVSQELYEMIDRLGLLGDEAPDPSSFSLGQRKAIVRASDLLDDARRILAEGL